MIKEKVNEDLANLIETQTSSCDRLFLSNNKSCNKVFLH